MVKKEIEYFDGKTSLKGLLVYEEKSTDHLPIVLVAHDWSGRNEFAEKKAENLAQLGYAAFAVDMYGDHKTGNTKDEKIALMQPLMHDRNIIRRRMLAAFEKVQKLEKIDKNKIGAIGFCFGGLCALDLARSGANVKGVVSFHGLLGSPENLDLPAIKSKVLVLHGFDDPMVTPDQVVHFGEEMTAAKVDWQINIYGNAMHAFTNPMANDAEFGTVYEKHADARSWTAMKEFFKEVFGF